MRLALLLLWLVPALSFAADPGVPLAKAKEFLAANQTLVLAEAPIYLEAPLFVTNGPVRTTLTSGYVVPVHSGDQSGPWVGFVWVRGEGDVELSFPEPGPALRFAMRMAKNGGDVEALRSVARDSVSFRTPAFEGFVLGATSDVGIVLEAYRLEKERLEAEVGEVVTVAGEDIVREAHRVLEDRLHTWDQAQVDIGESIALDRIRRELYESDRDGAFVLADWHTATDFPLEAEEHSSLVASDQDRGTKRLETIGSQWLTALRDDTGEWDTRLRTDVFTVIAFSRENVVFSHLSGEPFPPIEPTDPLSAKAATNRLVADFAESTVKIRPDTKDAMQLDAEVTSRLVFRAQGQVSVAKLSLPRGRTDQFAPTDIAMTVDGHDVVLAVPGEDRTDVTIALPHTAQDGDEVVIDAHFTAYWRYGELRTEGGAVVEGVAAGVSTGLRDYLPTPAGAFAGNPWRFETSVALPVQEQLVVALAGETVRNWSDPTWKWIQAAHEGSTALWPQVAVGKWTTVVDEPFEDLPGVRVNLFTGQRSVLTTFAPEIRRQALFYKGFLPPFPYPEVEVFEDSGQLFGFVWISPHGMIQVKQALVFDTEGSGGMRNDAPHLENAILAHELAHQYWGHVARPPSTRDFWIAETFAEGFSCMYVAAAFEKRDCEVRMKAKREEWERELKGSQARASLTEAYNSPFQGEIVYQYGPYVMFEMLQHRIGTAPFFAALDGMLRDRYEQPVTTETLQAYFEAASQQDLQDFFLFWVHGGYIPSVVVEWWKEPESTIRTRIAGRVTADVPFGTFDFPVVVTVDDGTTRTIWVKVTEGKGEFRTDSFRDPKKVEVDPEHLTLLRSRKAKKIARPADLPPLPDLPGLPGG